MNGGENPKSKIFINSFPKAGTHLAEKLFLLLGFNMEKKLFVGHPKPKRFWRYIQAHPLSSWDSLFVGVDFPTSIRASYVRNLLEAMPKGSFIKGHAIYSEYLAALVAENQLKTVVVIRDPRDIVVSHAHYVLKHERHPLHSYYKLKLQDYKACLKFSITGGRVDQYFLTSIGTRANHMQEWLEYTDSFLLRFEDIVGEKGGGSRDIQQETIANLCTYLNETISTAKIERVAGELYGGTSTFRKGKIASWQDAFDDEIEELFCGNIGDILAKWGYETGL